MLSNAFQLFESQVGRESLRVDSTVIRILYMGFVLSLIPMAADSPPEQAGLNLFRATTVVHTALAVLLAVRLAGDIAGDRASGLVGFLYLSGIDSRDVVLSRLLLVLTSFLAVWVIRVPILVLVYHLGGATLHQFFLVEVLQLGLFCMTVCAGLLLAHYSPDRTMSRLVFLLPALLELGLLIPSLLVATVHWLTPYHVPLSVEYAFDSLKYLRTTSCLFHSMQSCHPSTFYFCPLLLHVGMAGFCLWAWKRVYFTCLDEAAVPATPENEPQPLRPSKSKSRPSRPVWDDALAWQAYYVHSNGQHNVLARSLLIGACLAGTLFLCCWGDPDYQGIGMAILCCTTGLMMFIGRGTVGSCLQKEIKEQTLSSLLLTPHTAMELHDGWGRGAWKLMQPDLVLYVACGMGVLLYSPLELAPVIFGGATLLLASGPFLVLSPLVGYEFSGILTGVGLIAALLLIIAIAGIAAVAVHPWLGPVLLVPLAWGWNWLCRRVISRWFARRQKEWV